MLFGQGVSQSTLQTVRAFQSIANDGVMLQPRLIDSYINPDGTEEKVPAQGRRGRSSPRTPPSRSGTSSRAPSPRARSRRLRLDGYRVGAKTGTSQSPCDDGKAGFCGFTASIIGMAPMDDPRFIVEVVLQRPKGDIYGITERTGVPFRDEPGAADVQRPALHRRTRPAAAVRQVAPAREPAPARHTNLYPGQSEPAGRSDSSSAQRQIHQHHNGDPLVRAQCPRCFRRAVRPRTPPRASGPLRLPQCRWQPSARRSASLFPGPPAPSRSPGSP